MHPNFDRDIARGVAPAIPVASTESEAGPVPPRGRLALFAAVYVAGALLGQWPTLSPGLTATLWIPSGLTLAVLLLSDRRHWPHIVVTALAADLAVEILVYDFGPFAALVVAVGNVLEPLAGASLVLWWCGKPFRLYGVRNVLALTVLAAIVSPAISATLGAATLKITGAQEFAPAWLLWWLGDAIGVLIVAPLVIAVAQAKKTDWEVGPKRVAETATLLVLLVGTAHLFFSGRLPFAFIILPFLLWAALRFGVRGAALALALLAGMTFSYVTVGFEPFAAPYLSAYQRTVLVQAFLGIVSVSILLLAALIEQLNATLGDLHRLTDSLEERVKVKTAKLRASEARVRGIIDSQLSFVGQLSTDGTLIDVNQAALTVCDVERSEVVGKKFWDCYWGSYDAAIQTRLRAAIEHAASGKIVRYDEKFRIANDARIIVDFMVAPVRDSAGHITHLIPSGVDITERKRAENALAEKEEHLRLALESAGAADWSWDIVNNRLSWSDRYRALYGFKQDEPGDFNTWIERVHPDDRSQLERRVHIMLASPGDDRWREEFRILHPERGVVWLGGSAVMKRDSKGTAVHMTGINIDVTERRRNEFQLRLHQTAQSRLARLGALGELAAGIAHEINQPLMAARTYMKLTAETLASATASPEDARTAAEKAVGQIERAADVVRRLREFIQFGRSFRVPTAVSSIVQTAVTLMQPEIERAGVAVREGLQGDLPRVSADSLQIEQVLLNLLRNAVEAIADAGIVAGSVTIEAKQAEAGFVEICVRDNGPGFPLEQPTGPPQPFMTTKADGLGFGLSLSRSIVEAHGGRLWIGESSSGAAVHFTLLAAEEVSP